MSNNMSLEEMMAMLSDINGPEAVAPEPVAAVAPEPVAAIVRNDLIADDITKTFAANRTLNMVHFNDVVKPKLQREREKIKASAYTHELDCKDYDTVYVTSDLHADYRKFLQILLRARLITLPADITEASLFTGSIYDTRIITETTWNADRTCLIILGDLIDGKRETEPLRPVMEVEDPEGKFEILLHMFLFNLRIKAMQRNSFVAFTLGNHEYHSIMSLPATEADWFTRYVHNDAQFLYTNQIIRMNVLLPFYNVHPLFYISIINYERANRKEMLGIHAGFHARNGNYILTQLEVLQVRANNLAAAKTLNDIDKTHISFLADMHNDDGGLWSRFYDKNPDTACAKIEARRESVMFVVGHCPTLYNSAGLITNTKVTGLGAGGLYEGCMHNQAGRGCVVLSCNNKLAHVDVGMSTSFFPQGHWSELNKRLDKEMLRLTHDPALSEENRYYNIVDRFSQQKTTTMVRELPQAVAPAAIDPGALALPAINPGAQGQALGPTGGARRRRRMTKRRRLTRRRNTRRRH